MAKIIIPTPLRKFTGNQSTYETDQAATVGEAIQALTTEHSGLKKHLLDDQEQLRSFIRVYLGEDDINDLQQGATPIDQNAIISIVPAIAGGSR